MDHDARAPGDFEWNSRRSEGLMPISRGIKLFASTLCFFAILEKPLRRVLTTRVRVRSL